MKINYKNEDYKSPLYTCIILILIIVAILIWGFIVSGFKDIGFYMIILMMIIPAIICFKDYKKSKNERNKNLNIINNGKCYNGKIINAYEKYYGNYNGSGITETIVEVEFLFNGIIKRIVLNDVIRLKNSKKYINKEVNIYVYNNSYYVDIRG